jgi:hypothetical protein
MVARFVVLAALIVVAEIGGAAAQMEAWYHPSIA